MSTFRWFKVHTRMHMTNTLPTHSLRQRQHQPHQPTRGNIITLGSGGNIILGSDCNIIISAAVAVATSSFATVTVARSSHLARWHWDHQPYCVVAVDTWTFAAAAVQKAVSSGHCKCSDRGSSKQGHLTASSRRGVGEILIGDVYLVWSPISSSHFFLTLFSLSPTDSLLKTWFHFFLIIK